MRVSTFVSTTVLAACLVLPTTAHVSAGEPDKTTATAGKKKAPSAPSPARPSGVVRNVDPTDAYYGGPRNDSATHFQNDAGQTVYSIAASNFDISRPLLELAKAAPRERVDVGESPGNPQIPAARIIRSDIPDPVVQPVIEPNEHQTLSGVALAAPTTGFNFLGVGVNGGTPSDSNGSVGNNQFVETVNTRYQVWSLNRITKVATSLLGPSNINTVWAGFGGACEVQNSGDPIVLYDKQANRWLISQFTSSPSAGVYYQCVAVSTTANAAGTYARYAFAVPSGKFGDYPHIGVWQDAYYMMAHGFGGQFVAIFAAMDRPKMLAANPAATWVVIQDPTEGGHMPADLDGFAYPPNKAPGIFVSLHSEGMYIYRMKVNFSSPGASTNTLQAIVPVAPANAACGGGTCLPQPGSGVTLDAISDRLMFRAAYRNYIDHESLVVSHSVDPSVSGVVSGVRWYDIRISGAPDATCPTYPCLYQQGTIADEPNGRSRWMSSLAMDSAENILVGYTATGKTAGTDNHSARYTGRAKSDPPGLMTAPEATIFTGTANNVSNTRWGDYSSMSVDPADDCTFWYVSQYYAAQNQWSTRIASAAFPTGTGAGQCQPTTCLTRPPTVPLIGTATTPADNEIKITWTGMTPTPGAYAIERAPGVCGAEGLYQPVGAVAGTVTEFTDSTVQAGVTYAYRVRGATDASGRCNAQFASGCVNATATGNCALKPSFAGATSASSLDDNNCGLTINWTPGTSACLAAPDLRYNIFRSTELDFVPSVSNRIATCVFGNSYVDTDNLQSGITYYYVVHAEDGSTGNGGACNGGNEESNSARVAGTPYGAGMQAAPGTWTDGGGDGSAFLTLNVPGGGNTGDPSWRLVKTTSDPGANHTPGGSYAYRNAGPTAANTYLPGSCTEVQAPSLTVGASTVNLMYWERHQIEYQWDAMSVEFSVNGGAFADVPPPSNDPGAGCAPSDDTTGWEPLGCSQVPPNNACSFPSTKVVLSGPLESGATCGTFVTGATTPYAHRCHRITGLSPDDTIRFRWRFSSDEASEHAGFYLDDIAVTNVRVPNACTPDTCRGQADGTACADGDPCTAGDTCGGGACDGGAMITPPAEATSVTVAADKSTYGWSALASANRYGVVRGSLSALPVGPGGADEACFDNLPGPSLVDATLPAADSGFWYLSRGENDCGSGTLGQQSSGASRVTATCP